MYNLVIVASPSLGDPVPFMRLGRYVSEADRAIRVHVLIDGPAPAHRLHRYLLERLLVRTRPTLVFSPAPTRFSPVRGLRFSGARLTKSQQYRRLEECGLPVPRWVLLTPRHHPDLSAFDRFVVVKPDGGRRGAEVRVVRKPRVRWRPVHVHGGINTDGLVVQEFIYTGPWPTSFRVSTLFGQALWALRIEADRARPPLPAPDGFDRIPGGRGVSVVSSGRRCTMALCDDADVIRLAERTHAAFPDVPLLGVDIVRRHPDGLLYVLEVNPRGGGWHFGTSRGLRAEREFGFSLETQFDGLRKAARILAQTTRAQAC